VWGFVSLLGANAFGAHLPLLINVLLIAFGIGLWLVGVGFLLKALQLHRQATGQPGSERLDDTR
jgi:hypothetical protein